jgi:hypothetical protein
MKRARLGLAGRGTVLWMLAGGEELHLDWLGEGQHFGCWLEEKDYAWFDRKRDYTLGNG